MQKITDIPEMGEEAFQKNVLQEGQSVLLFFGSTWSLLSKETFQNINSVMAGGVESSLYRIPKTTFFIQVLQNKLNVAPALFAFREGKKVDEFWGKGVPSVGTVLRLLGYKEDKIRLG